MHLQIYVCKNLPETTFPNILNFKFLNFIHFIQVIVIILIYLLFSFLTLFHIIIYNLYFLIEVKLSRDHILQVQLAVHICVLVVRHLLQCVAFGFGFLVS